MNYSLYEKMKKIILIIAMILICISCKKDNSTSPTTLTVCTEPIYIGTQVWICKNLDIDHYRNGDAIPEVKDFKEWSSLTTGAWCYYNNDSTMGAKYGKLYNWFALTDPRGLAPDGWHVPTDAEFTKLETFLGGTNLAGGKLKSTGTKEDGDGLWWSQNVGATNESSFAAHPGGYRFYNGTFGNLGYFGYWWSYTEDNVGYAWSRFLYYDNAYFSKLSNNKNCGFSIRCVKSY